MVRIDAIVVIATAFAQRLGMDVTVEDLNVAAAADIHAVSSAGPDLGVLDSDVVRVYDLDAVSSAGSNS
jgi:hypothetical protein